MSKYPFFIHSLLLTHYFKALREARGFRPIFLINFNIKPHLDAFEAGLWFLWLESICNHASSAMAYTHFPVAIAMGNLAER
ncbi:hypothetical protein H6G91_30590 [Nostoc muscorum FACHB-395]|nr:hypothetical protein [Desmonostoc muscorum FACHB-395]